MAHNELANATPEDLERWAKVLDDAAMSIAFYDEQPDNAYFGLASLARAVAKMQRLSEIATAPHIPHWELTESGAADFFYGGRNHPETSLPAALASLLNEVPR